MPAGIARSRSDSATTLATFPGSPLRLPGGQAALTVASLGTLFALTQTDIKRMLAYSSIAQAGFILVGVLAISKEGLASSMFYLIAYAFTTIGAFAIVSMVRDSSGEATHLSSWAGLGKKSPLVAGAFALFLLAFAGIPFIPLR